MLSTSPRQLMHFSRLLFLRGRLTGSSFVCLSKVRILRQFTSTRVLSIDNLTMDTINTTERLKNLRHLMSENKIDVYSMASDPSSFERMILIFSKLSLLKTATRVNTSHLVMPVEVRMLGQRIGEYSLSQ